MRGFLAALIPALATATALGQSFNIDINNNGAAFGAGVPTSAFGGAAAAPGFWNAINNVPGPTTTLRGLDGVLTTVTLQTTGTIIIKDANDGSASGDFAKLMEDGWESASAGDSMAFTVSGLEAGSYFVFVYGDPPDSNQQETRVTIDGSFQNVGGSHNTNEFVQNVTHSRHMVKLSAGQSLTAAITNNSFVGGSRAYLGGLQITKLPERLYVNDNAAAGGDGLAWATAFQNPGEALDAAGLYGGAIEEIWVATGTYFAPSVPILGPTFALRDGVRMYGGFAGTETQLSQRNPSPSGTFLSGSVGGPLPNDNAWHVVSARSCGADTLIDGFTIANGYADGTLGWDMYGGGMWIDDSQLRVRNCTFVANYGWRGGAVAVQNSTPRIEGCYFFNNTAEQVGGGVLTLAGGAPKIVDCDFRLNHATVNYGGAIAHYEGTNMHVFNCRFFDNDCGWGGGAIFTEIGNCTVGNCIFTGNSGVADRGGALHTFGDNVYLFVYNCTVVGNSNYSCGGIDAFAGANVFVRNSIIYGNTDAAPETDAEAEQLREYSDSSMTVSFCDVQGWSGILGGGASQSFAAVPQFVDSDGADNVLGTLDDDLRLLPVSPCIDRGSNALLPGDAADVDLDNNVIEYLPLDLDGNARRLDDPATADLGAGTAPIVDLGAYEFAPPCEFAGDLEPDGDVDLTDLATLLANFGTVGGMTRQTGDVDGDGNVDLTDLASLLANYGSVCD